MYCAYPVPGVGSNSLMYYYNGKTVRAAAFVWELLWAPGSRAGLPAAPRAKYKFTARGSPRESGAEPRAGPLRAGGAFQEATCSPAGAKGLGRGGR